MPADGRADATLALLADPYRFIARRARALGSDAFATRLMLRPTICLTGPAAAALFYDATRFERRGAAPEPLQATLFGKGALQSLDGAEHEARKAMFLALMTPARIEDLVAAFARELVDATHAWAARRGVVLYDAIQPVLARAVCAWAGVPLPGADVPLRTRQLVALFDQAAALGGGHLRSRRARRALEAWLEALVEDVRAGRRVADPSGALHAVAMLRRPNGLRLPPRVAAVELLNVLRPTVAVAVYVVDVAHALHAHPAVRARLRTGDAAYRRAFVQEVRRFYPFFPAVVARVREDFAWRGLRFPRGTRTMLDLHGTNRDPRTWAAPDAFRPERFLNRPADAYDFVPQGGGDPRTGHRCPGEWITLALMEATTEAFARRLRHAVPRQDLRLDWTRLPSLPRSGFVLADAEPLRPDDVAGIVRAARDGAAASPAAGAPTPPGGRDGAPPRPGERGRPGAGTAQSAP
jgi:fatty-acid peroxygenase